MKNIYKKYLCESGKNLKIDTNSMSFYSKVIDHTGFLEGDKKAEEYFLEDVNPIILDLSIDYLEDKFIGKSQRIEDIQIDKINTKILFDIDGKVVPRINLSYTVKYDDGEEETFSEMIHPESFEMDLLKYFE